MVEQVEEGRLVAGRYRLLERIGRGGMGTVWRAEDELLGRQVAVKKLHPPQPHMHDDELATLFERTRREARAAARISHPNVIVVHDVVDDAGLPSIVMEYVASVTLSERLKQQGAMSPEEAARIGRGMIAALRAAHRAGVLHRDVKPGNVLLGDGEAGAGDCFRSGGHGGDRVVLTDFGIAQASGTSTLTRTGELIGSIDFLAPERIRGALPGPEADLWALGATLYQAVEGESPFRRPTAIETAYAIAEEPLRPPAHAGALIQVISGLLVKEPEKRLSAAEAERMLRVPAAEPDTALVEQGGFPARGGSRPTEPPADGTDHREGAHRPGTYPPGAQQPVPYGAGSYRPGPYDPGPYEPGPYPSGTHPQPPPYAGHGVPRRRRTAPWIAGAVTAAVLAGGGAVTAAHFRSSDNGGTDPGPTGGPVTTTAPPPTTAPTPPVTTPPPPPVPAGYHLATRSDRDYFVPVPDDWTENVKDGGDEVNYVDPTGLVGLKISALDFGSTNPYQHWLNLEPVTRGQVDGYHRERLDPTTRFGDQAAIWQFTFKGQVRDYRAIDLGFGKPGGREYAIYLSAPKAQWDIYRPVFETAVAGFRQTAG
ncbi:serine/threonine-protein kinase [Streptomyces sp.]|uniref:serine/threonine-protein kinase n=1 Tax=Streptomyces sp. TaxID=1931 RepID=UPI002F3EBDE1